MLQRFNTLCFTRSSKNLGIALLNVTCGKDWLIRKIMNMEL